MYGPLYVPRLTMGRAQAKSMELALKPEELTVSRRTQHLASTGSLMHRKTNITIAGYENLDVFRYIVSTLSSGSFVLILFLCSCLSVRLISSVCCGLSPCLYLSSLIPFIIFVGILKIDMSGHRLV